MPPLEAMACGCPAVISSDPALVEVAGPAALVVDPHDHRAPAEAIDTLAFDWPLRRRIVQRGLRHAQGFSWQQAAIQTHAVYARVGAGAIPEPSLNDTRNGTGSRRRATHRSWSGYTRGSTSSCASSGSQRQASLPAGNEEAVHGCRRYRGEAAKGGWHRSRARHEDGSADCRAGRQTLELRNAAKKPRGFDLVTFQPGKGPRDLDRCAEGGEKGKPPAKLLGAMQSIAPGTPVFLTASFERGRTYYFSDDETNLRRRFTAVKPPRDHNRETSGCGLPAREAPRRLGVRVGPRAAEARADRGRRGQRRAGACARRRDAVSSLAAGQADGDRLGLVV